MSKPFRYGGQAVIEGVMIRGQRHMTVAVRRPDGGIALHIEALGGPLTEGPRRVPLLRGALALWEALYLGTKALIFSANAALGEEEERISPLAMGLTLGLALAAAAAIFFASPALLTGWLEARLGSSLGAVLLEGLVRLGLLLGYIYAIGFLPDIRRVFAYHGAEHKAINALEAGAPLEAGSVQAYSTAHPRCGTAFLLLVALISIIVFALVGSQALGPRLLSRLLLIPVIAALGYEALHLGARHPRNRLIALLLRPGLLLQSLTTRQPDDGQVEVALRALKEAMAADADRLTLPAPADAPEAPSAPRLQ